MTGVTQQRVLVLVAMQAADPQMIQPAPQVLDHMARLGDGVARIGEAWTLACGPTAAVVRRKRQQTVRRQHAPGLGEDPEPVRVRNRVEYVVGREYKIELRRTPRRQIPHVGQMDLDAGQRLAHVIDHLLRVIDAHVAPRQRLQKPGRASGADADVEHIAAAEGVLVSEQREGLRPIQQLPPVGRRNAAGVVDARVDFVLRGRAARPRLGGGFSADAAARGRPG